MKRRTITADSNMMLDTSIDFTDARAQTVAEIIQQEVHKRTLVNWKLNNPQAEFSLQLEYDQSLNHDEKYVVAKPAEKKFTIRGKTTRALIYGAGKWMRCLDLDYVQDYSTAYAATVRVSAGVSFPLSSTPRYTWRGHQIAYRPKTHSYDAITVEQMKQELLDQVLWGCNVVEMIPPKLDDCKQSPHFPDPWPDRLAAMSHWCHQLDVKVSLWYPAFPGADWGETYRALKRFDILFVPGGDPGGREPAEFFPIVREHAQFARQFFPNIEVWVSSQFGLATSPDLGLTPWAPKSKLESWYKEVEKNQDLLTGVVYGPWTADDSKQFRERVPAKLPIRDYPDLCHNLRSQYPVGPSWDFAFAATYNRESINPRPKYFADTFAYEMPWCEYGAGCYSEGCGDDVNKHVWSALLWGPTDATAIMEEYAKWYIGDKRVAGLILALEQNWLKPLKSGFVIETLKSAISLLGQLPGRITRNWRWQMIYFRAVCDAYLYARQYGDKENRSLAWPVEGGSSVPWITHFDKQEKKVKWFVPSAMALYGRLEASAGLLYGLMGMQLDVSRYGSMHEERGGHLELLDSLPPDDGVAKGKFTVLRLHEVPTTGYDGPILDHADTTSPAVVSTIQNLPTRWLTFYSCIWPNALPLEIEVEMPKDGAQLEIVYIGEDLLLEGGDYEELYRCAVPVRCTCNGELLHDYQPAAKTTGPRCYALPSVAKGVEKLRLVWDVADRQTVTVRSVPVPVADVRVIPRLTSRI